MLIVLSWAQIFLSAFCSQTPSICNNFLPIGQQILRSALPKMELSWECRTNLWVMLPEAAIDIAVLLMSGAGLCIAVHLRNPFTAMPQYWDFTCMASHLSTKAEF
jgi:hypothetical protein